MYSAKYFLKIGNYLYLSSSSLQPFFALLLRLSFVMNLEAKELVIPFSKWASVIRCFVKDLSDLLNFCHTSISP